MASQPGKSDSTSAAGTSKKVPPTVKALLDEFVREFQPLEGPDKLFVLIDARTKANYCECHIRASKMVPLSTIDVPLDPEEQAEYRANREIVADHVAFERMKEDALAGRSFSNIVAEHNKTFDASHPLKIIGGQHRYEAIKLALDSQVDEWHGVKVYFGLDPEQRLDVQLISNTNIAVSPDLFDRMQETIEGPQLREWCQEVGLLEKGQDFADKRQRGRAITVQAARSFITNYFKGRSIDQSKADDVDTTPSVGASGVPDTNWQSLKKNEAKLWDDLKLKEAGREFAKLIQAQRGAFAADKTKGRSNLDFPEKALNFAVFSGWAYVAGMLQSNPTRLKRHYDLSNAKGKDPLNAAALAKGRHKTDPENYRGLGYRTDVKERGRFVELFRYQAEKGEGISPSSVEIAIKKYHAKQAHLEALDAERRAADS